MRGVYSVAQVRAAEDALMAKLPPNTLMHRAAFALAVETAELAREYELQISGLQVCGLVGSGNNGSDTLWGLSLLAKRGVSVSAVDITASRKPDHTDDMFRDAGGRWLELVEWLETDTDADIYLDGIAGLGSSRPVAREIVERALQARVNGALLVAVDLPSGVDADTAQLRAPLGAVEADLTVTFGALKPCHVLDPALEYCGEVVLVDIGLELDQSQIQSFDDTDAALLLEAFAPHHTSHKYARGVVNIVAGSAQYPGAGQLCARAARWGGAGMVRQVGEGAQFDNEAAATVVQQEAHPADAWVVGPGLSADVSPVIDALEQSEVVVLDAQALNLLATESHLQSLVGMREGVTVMTPHGGEFSRLLVGYRIEQSGIPHRDAQVLAFTSGAVVYLKGSVGVIATPQGELIATRRTSEHLATAGSGDVLAGLMGSMLAALQPSENGAAARVAATAVVVHSLAAEIIANDGEPVTADELEQMLPAAIAQLRGLE